MLFRMLKKSQPKKSNILKLTFLLGKDWFKNTGLTLTSHCKMKLVENLIAFGQESSIHGLNFIAKRSYSNVVRITWLGLFMGALSYAVIQISYEAEGN